MSNPIDFKHFFLDQVVDLVNRSNHKFSCIEDQFYYVDKFPRYEEDDKNVFKCKDCGCLVQVDCLRECDRCEQNFCDFTHTQYSVCDKQHDCAKRNLRSMISRHTTYGSRDNYWCVNCIQQNNINRVYYFGARPLPKI